jgi:CBS domain-containing protein
MQTISRLRRSGIGVAPDRTLSDVAKLMSSSGIGTVAVLDGDDLVGIVTDRDLVRRGLARGLPPDARVDGVMSSPVVTIEADTDLHEAIATFGEHALRRLAVVDHGAFVGIISLDDLLVDVSTDLWQLTSPLAVEISTPQRDGALPVPR